MASISSWYGSILLALWLIVTDSGLSTLCHSSGFSCQQRVLKTFPRPGFLCSKNVVVWLWHPLVNLYIWLTISYCYDSIPLALGMMGSDGCFSTLCQSCGFACQQRVLKTFPGPGYLCSEGEVVWLWHPLIDLCIWLTISSCYVSNHLVLGLTGTDGCLSTLCHSSGFSCQQRVPKTFPGPGYLCSENVLVWLWHPPVNLYIWLTISYCYDSIPLALGLIDWDGCISTLCQSCGFACQQKVLKFFSGTGCLCSADGVVCLWHPLATGQSL